MPKKPNYDFQKRQKELARKRKKEEKRAGKRADRELPDANAESAPEALRGPDTELRVAGARLLRERRRHHLDRFKELGCGAIEGTARPARCWRRPPLACGALKTAVIPGDGKVHRSVALPAISAFVMTTSASTPVLAPALAQLRRTF
jgi:hypothetical protein